MKQNVNACLKQLGAAMTISLMANACSWFGGTEITQRYKSADFDFGAFRQDKDGTCWTVDKFGKKHQAVSINLSSSRIDPPRSLRPTDMPERALAAYIEQVAKIPGVNLTGLQAAISQPLDSAAKSAIFEDQTEFSRRLAITIARQGLPPGDRLTWTLVAIDLGEEKAAEFSGWSLLKSEEKVIDLGSLKRSTGRGTSADASLGFVQVIPANAAASVKASADEKIEESVSLSENEVLTPIIEPSKLRIIHAGTSKTQLEGNIVFDVQLRLKEDPSIRDERILRVNDLFDKAGKPLASEKVNVRYFTNRRVPAPKDDLRAKVSVDYVLRRIENDDGRDTPQ